MLKMIEISEIIYRWGKGLKIRAIARSLGYSRNTVRDVIRRAEELGIKIIDNDSSQIDNIVSQIVSERYDNKSKDIKDISTSNPDNKKVKSKLTKFYDQIKSWLTEKYMTITQIHRLIKEAGVDTSESSIRRYISEQFPKEKSSTIPMFTAPGEEAQVDYGYVGMIYDELTHNIRKAYVFVMTLSYSRYRYVEFSFSQNISSWVQSHINSFIFFNGVPKTISLDNLKSGVIKANIYDPTINKTYAELERFYGFVADPNKIFSPKHKGKVEKKYFNC